MLFKKIIGSFLILVLVLQLLPVRQVIKYFFVDNQMTEEIVDLNKGATKNMRFLDEDKLMHEIDLSFAQFENPDKEAFFHYNDVLPAFHTIEILTPPPNQA